nr:peptidoglycan O-acetyltransferase [uncultured bacterium]
MLFSSMTFLEFFPVVWTVHWLLPRPRQRHCWLVITSAIFYGAWNWRLLALLAATGAFNYVVVAAMDQTKFKRTRHRLLWLALMGNLGQLALFKYANFFSTSVAVLLNGFGLHATPVLLHLVLPLGISFYTFEFIAYAVDVYRGDATVRRDPLHFALYVLFFPRLIAGPIVRPNEFFPQLERPRRFSWLRTQVGFQFFVWGYFKKVCVADPVGAAIDPFFADPMSWGSAGAWLAVLAYSVQIYCDFSGYSDMAIGLGQLLGVRLPDNFRLPYLAADVREFWQRWHLSLSRWIRDYLYITMGGGRASSIRRFVNVLVVMSACGLWHGAQWTFIAWGAIHGAALGVHRAMPWPQWLQSRSGRAISVAATFLFVTLAWVPFRAPSFAAAGAIFERLLIPSRGAAISEPTLVVLALGLLAAAAMHVRGLELRWRRIEARWPSALVGVVWAALVFLIHVLTPLQSSTFIYFQF